MTQFARPSDLPPQPALIDPRVRIDGSRLSARTEWDEQRAYLKHTLQHYLYGDLPDRPVDLRTDEESISDFGEGGAVLRFMTLTTGRNGREASLRVGLITPPGQGPFPVIIKNDAYRFDISETTDPSRRKKYAEAGRDTTEDRVFREAVDRGYAICKFVRTDWADDVRDSKGRGIYPLYPECEWGAITVWAWTFSVIIDWLTGNASIDTDRVAVTGHSRGGKTALAAGILDNRIAVTAPNSSGGGGTGSFRFFEPGARQQRIDTHLNNFPHWWHPRFYEFHQREDHLPFDAHTLKSLIAPRPLFNAHALQDDWANPYGTQLTYEAAQCVFRWTGAPSCQGIHWREGGHDQNEEDWIGLLDFCDVHLRGVSRERSFTERPFDYTSEHRRALDEFRALFT